MSTDYTYVLFCTDKGRHDRKGIDRIRVERIGDDVDTFKVSHEGAKSAGAMTAHGILPLHCARCKRDIKIYAPNLGKILFRFSEATGVFHFDISYLP